VYLAQLNITNFRKLKQAQLNFQKGLNVLVGANNAGKTAVVDALRSLLAGHEEPYPRLDTEDLHRPKDGSQDGAIVFQYVFRDLSEDDEADFLAALKPGRGRKVGSANHHPLLGGGQVGKTARQTMVWRPRRCRAHY
jgi:putative ATP-dependent endonuclease of OLD family